MKVEFPEACWASNGLAQEEGPGCVCALDFVGKSKGEAIGVVKSIEYSKQLKELASL